jgi:hypothetical protein
MPEDGLRQEGRTGQYAFDQAPDLGPAQELREWCKVVLGRNRRLKVGPTAAHRIPIVDARQAGQPIEERFWSL